MPTRKKIPLINETATLNISAGDTLDISGGDISLVGSGSAVITFPATSGTLAKITDITGTNSGTNTGDEVDMTASVGGLVPTPPNNTTTFLRGDGTFATPSGSGDALVANPLSQFAATSSAQLLGVMSDETGTGALVFATSPTLVTPALGTPTSVTLTNATGLPLTGLVASTSTAIGVGSVELGHASDTTLARTAAGEIAVEGIRVLSARPKILSAASYTTDTGSSLNVDDLDFFIVTAQTGALLFNAPGGTKYDGQMLKISIASSTTVARALTWNVAFGATTVALPSTTAATTATLTAGFIWSTSKSLWQCVAVA